MKDVCLLVIASTLFILGCQPKSDPAPTAPSSTPVGVVTPQSATTPSQADALMPSHILGDIKSPLSEGVTLTSDHAGVADNAFAFTGNASFIESAVNINPDALPVCTMVTWAKFTGDPASESTQQVVSQDDGGYDRSIGLDNRAGKWGWSCFVGNRSVAGGFQVEPNKWTFLAAVFDQPAQKVTFYAGDEKIEVNEVEMGNGLEIVRVGSNPSYGEHFTGEIEPVKLYTRALSEEEIQNLRAR